MSAAILGGGFASHHSRGESQLRQVDQGQAWPAALQAAEGQDHLLSGAGVAPYSWVAIAVAKATRIEPDSPTAA